LRSPQIRINLLEGLKLFLKQLINYTMNKTELIDAMAS